MGQQLLPTREETKEKPRQLWYDPHPSTQIYDIRLCIGTIPTIFSFFPPMEALPSLRSILLYHIIPRGGIHTSVRAHACMHGSRIFLRLIVHFSLLVYFQQKFSFHFLVFGGRTYRHIYHTNMKKGQRGTGTRCTNNER